MEISLLSGSGPMSPCQRAGWQSRHGAGVPGYEKGAPLTTQRASDFEVRSLRSAQQS